MKKLWVTFKHFLQIIVCMGLGFYAVAFSLQTNIAIRFLQQVYNSAQGRLIAMIIGIFFISLGLLLILISTKTSAEGKSITFDNPIGKVKISLSAIEDFIRKIALQISGIQAIKPLAIARKNKIIIDNRVVIWGSENLLTISNKAQEEIQSYLQEILGGEEKVEINMHIVKVLQDVTKLKTEPVETHPEQTPLKNFP